MRLWPILSIAAILGLALVSLAPLVDEPAELPFTTTSDDEARPVVETAFTLDEAPTTSAEPAETDPAHGGGEETDPMTFSVDASASENSPSGSEFETATDTVEEVHLAPEADPEDTELILDPPRSLQIVDLAFDLGDPVMVVPHPLHPGTYFILDHDGTIRLFDPTFGVHPTPLLDFSEKIRSSGESGAHALAFHPRDPSRSFLIYNDLEGALFLTEIPFAPQANAFDVAAERVLLRVPPAHGAHNGGALLFGPDGYLYLSVGDGGSQDDPDGRVQDLSQLHGKILRIDVDHVRGAYGVPSDNPSPSSEVWLYGFRNPWRMTFDSATGDLWIADVGGSIAEEINRHAAEAPAGLNYGWPIWEGTTQRRDREIDAIAPMHEYKPASGRCAITGGVFYRHSTLLPLKDAYLYSDFCDGKLRAFEKGDTGWGTREVMDLGRLVVQITEDHDHTLLVLRYGGVLSRIVFA